MKFKYIIITLLGFTFVKCSFQESENGTKQDKNAKIILKTETQSDIATTSEITCPKCGYKKLEKLPTDVCVIKYNCEKCNQEMFPKNGDCCVYCTYGTHKCPTKQ